MRTFTARTPTQWHAWLDKHHDACAEVWLVIYKAHTGQRTIAMSDAVDEALCFGWIDSLVKRLDEDRYAVKFTPRKANSKWSEINRKRYAELEAAGLVHAAGKAARAKWADGRRSGYSHDTPESKLDAAGLRALSANAKARRFWEAQTPSYRKIAGHWVVRAKREATRAAHLATLIDCCARGVAIPPFAKYLKVKRPA